MFYFRGLPHTSFSGGPMKELHNEKGQKDVSTNYYFMLILISERAHSQIFFPLSKGDI